MCPIRAHSVAGRPVPRSQDPWRCAECGFGGPHRAHAGAHEICALSAAFREHVLQLVEQFPRVPLDRIAADLGGGYTAADIERFVLLARARRDSQRAAAEGWSPERRP